MDPCAFPLGGAAWQSSLPEAEPGFEALVEATSLEGLPAALDTSTLNAINRALLAYALELPQEDIQAELRVEQVEGVHPKMAEAVLASFAQKPSFALDSSVLRRGLHRYYACARGLPLTRDDFKARYGDYHQFATRVVAHSIPKQAERTLFEDPDAGVFVAENEGPEGLETEVILQDQRGDGALDFLVFDAAGRLVDRAPLAMTSQPEVLPVPFACAMCHRTMITNVIDSVDPGSPAGP